MKPNKIVEREQMLLTANEVAQRTGLSIRTVQRWITKGISND